MAINELFRLKEDTKQNTKDISELTNVVTRLATIQENAEKQREEDRMLLRELAKNAESLDRKISEALHIVADVNKLKEDYRALNHDFKNHDNVIVGLVPKIEAIIKNDVRQAEQLDVLNKWHDREREKDLIAVGGEKLKQKQWKTITAVASAAAAVAGFVVWLAGFLFK